MRLVIDLQGAQASNRHRGIGRYALSLASTILKHADPDTVVVALNGALTESVMEIRGRLRGLIRQENIRLWYPVETPSASDSADWNRNASKAVFEAFLARLSPDVVLVTSLIEGFHDGAITTIGTEPRLYRTAVVLYDLIPLIMRDAYLRDDAYAAWYEKKLEEMRSADLHLCISESTRQDAIALLGLEASPSANISAAVDPMFRPQAVTPDTENGCRERTGIRGPFLMYTGGIDHRKNIEGLIRAFGQLPRDLLDTHSLAIVCAVGTEDRGRLMHLAARSGLSEGNLCLPGYVSDEDLVTLYNLCDLFVFPSLHEGFGLPVLEAMRCGCPVIASNRASIPEVVGMPEALFEPDDEQGLAAMIERAIRDPELRNELAAHSIRRAEEFSWDRSAGASLDAIRGLLGSRRANALETSSPAARTNRPRMAFVAPMPPDKSGIADYCVELLPELCRHYVVDVVTPRGEVSDTWVADNCRVIDVALFRDSASAYARILYHFGNSAFHEHMFELLERFPGTVVMHDAYLSSILAHMEVHNSAPGAWVQGLYSSHGYTAVAERYAVQDTADVVWKYPCNIDVLRQAVGVIVHSREAVRQAYAWYAADTDARFHVIPLMRRAAGVTHEDRQAARMRLGVAPDEVLVCSFGLLGPTKLNHRLLHAWLGSHLAEDPDIRLTFVGQNDGGDYGRKLKSTIRRSGCSDRIRITGWADRSTYEDYLKAADVAVQLRGMSRGETSAAVLDCMNYGVATLVNACGSMQDLNENTVLKISDDFTDAELKDALVALCSDRERRVNLGAAAQRQILEHHDPATCGDTYANAIESFYGPPQHTELDLIHALGRLSRGINPDKALPGVAKAIDMSICEPIEERQLLVDVSELVQRDSETGIQRVVKNILTHWLKRHQPGLRIEPVYAVADEPGYRYARKFALRFLNCPGDWLEDEPITFRAGDHFLGLDLQPHVVPAQEESIAAMRRHGVIVKFVVYDLLPITLPHCFVEGGAQMLDRWLTTVCQSDGVLCISKSVAHEFGEWRSASAPSEAHFEIEWFHLGADFSGSGTRAAARTAPETKPDLAFLMVGTLEPRKSHAAVIDAFEQLWSSGTSAKLVIVGKKGWLVEPLVERILNHREHGGRLVWIPEASDAELETLYAEADCLIAASLGEGFGLPVVEAAARGIPLLVRDIPPFRELAGDHACYFSERPGEELITTLQRWLEGRASGSIPDSSKISLQTWAQCSENLLNLALGCERTTQTSAALPAVANFRVHTFTEDDV